MFGVDLTALRLIPGMRRVRLRCGTAWDDDSFCQTTSGSRSSTLFGSGTRRRAAVGADRGELLVVGAGVLLGLGVSAGVGGNGGGGCNWLSAPVSVDKSETSAEDAVGGEGAKAGGGGGVSRVVDEASIIGRGYTTILWGNLSQTETAARLSASETSCVPLGNAVGLSNSRLGRSDGSEVKAGPPRRIVRCGWCKFGFVSCSKPKHRGRRVVAG
jgi:hypothetical protein